MMPTVIEEAAPRCVHCGDEDLNWVKDPAPDLCATCASNGLWSEMWGPDRAAEYRELLRTISVERGFQ